VARRAILASVLVSAVIAIGLTASAQEAAPQPAPAPPAAYEPPVVLTHEEPHHRQVFQYGPTRILDLRIPPNDITWFHTHEWPVLYVSFSNSQTRMETLGQTDQGAQGGGAGARGGAAPRGGPPGSARGGSGQPGGPRATSTTSYFERPVTHRLANIGTNLVRAMVVVNETPGDDTTSEQAARFEGEPELTNKWFRSYRRTLQPGETSPAHNHGAPVAIIQATAGKGLAEGSMKFELNETGQWAFFDAGVPHNLRNLGETALELLEIEVRLPP
jgi:quercetin dioxygenase-like cupin family protein